MSERPVVRERTETHDVVVCGGGLAGLCAALAAARRGARVALVHDRPVLGGNSSSEVRVTPHGAATFHGYARETGIVSELLIEERARNHEEIFENGWTNSVWDLVLYDAARAEPGLTLHLNTAVEAVELLGPRRLGAVTARVAGAETRLRLEGRVFVDCTGDGVVAHLAGCGWRMGSEGRDEFDEPHAPETASPATMGSSLLFKTKDVGRPAPYSPPDWAARYEDASFFYDAGRVPDEPRGGYWWLEVGAPWDTIADNETIRHELTRHALGVWDWMKNKDPRLKDRLATVALDWLGQVPGKRESRRIMGRYLMTEHDPLNRTVFSDEVAFGGWFIDLHTPGGLLAATSEYSSAEGYSQTSEYAQKSYAGPYGIPLRTLIAKDADNLLMAGRNVSVTHAALGTVRVMNTTALMGQAAGTAAAIALGRGLEVWEVPERAIREVQQALLRDGCFLPNARNEDGNDLARRARASASSHARLVGVGPESASELGGLSGWADTPLWAELEPLRERRGQWIAVGPGSDGRGRLDAVDVCLSNPGERPERVEARLVAVDHIWDYRAGGAGTLAETTLEVEPGERRWVRWPLDLELEANRYVRLDLLPNERVRWHPSRAVEPGHLAAFEMGGGRMRRLADGVTMSFRVSPPQPCYGPENVLSGVARPHRSTNLWRSDPAQPLPAWLELWWPEPVALGAVELTFPGHLLRKYHAYPPFYRDPQCARDYVLSVELETGWREVVTVRGNYQRHRRHRLAGPVTTRRLRLTVLATNGDPSAALYELRCYGPEAA